MHAPPGPPPPHFIDRLSRPGRWAILAVLFAIYLALYFLIYPWVGFGISLLVLLPVAITAWFFGLREGLWSSLAGVVINLALFWICAPGRWAGVALSFGLPNALVTPAVAALVGYISDLRYQAQQDLAKNARLFEEASQHAARLARANSVIVALNHVVARLFQPEPEAVLQTLVLELQPLGISCLVAMLEESGPAFVARYSTLRSQAARAGQALPPSHFEFRPDNFQYFGDIQAQRGVFAANIQSLLDALLRGQPGQPGQPGLPGLPGQPGLPAQPAQPLNPAAAITANTHAIFTPLVLDGRVVGLLALWSEILDESDLPTAAVFASQVTLALHNASLYADAQHDAITDYLTGLYNRRGLMELGQREVERALRYDRPLTAIMVDVDFFKEFNDRYSYAIGDLVLQEVARRIRHTVREIDVAARFGGEEFVLLIVENSRSSALLVAERLRASISEVPFDSEAGPLAVTVSLGLASLAPHMPDLDQLLAAAGEALHAAKAGGRNRVEVRK